MLKHRRKPDYVRMKIVLCIILLGIALFILISKSVMMRRFSTVFFLLFFNAFLSFGKFRLFRYLNLRGMMAHMAAGIELCTFAAVVAGIRFGPGVGALTGSAAIISSYIVEQRVSKFSLGTVPLYALIGFAAAHFSESISNVVFLGVAMSLFYNILISLILFIGYRANPVKMALFSLVNVLFNAYVFYNLSSLF